MAARKKPPVTNDAVARVQERTAEFIDNDDERAAFIDAAAIAVFASGWPLKTVYERAEQLWKLREAYLAGKRVRTPLGPTEGGE